MISTNAHAQAANAASPPGAAASAAAEAARVEGPTVDGGKIEGGEDSEGEMTPISAAADDNAFKWEYGRKPWHGLYFSASRRTKVESSVDAAPILNFQEVKFAGSLGGRLEFDGAGYDTNGSLTGFDSGFDLRRARFTAKGASIFGVGYTYRVDLGYVPGSFTITQAYIGIPGVRYLGTVEFGQFTPPVGMQVLTSSWDIPLMEPAAPLQAMAPSSQPGVQASNTFMDERGTWAFGVYTGVGGGGDYGSGSKSVGNLMGRATWLAVDDITAEHPSANHYLHLGLSANMLFATDGQIRYRSRPESYLAPYAIDTGTLNVTKAGTLDAEVLWVNGPFTAQGEVIASRVHAGATGALDFGGAYALASWYLTGESRAYNRNTGLPGRLIPLRNFGFGPDAGWGAFEVAARASYTNLSDGAVQGGKLSMLMTSLNWYLRPELKCMFELGTGRVSDAASGNGRMVIAQLRMGVYFY
ncbi:MAG: porin [Burkholderiales bacterium]